GRTHGAHREQPGGQFRGPPAPGRLHRRHAHPCRLASLTARGGRRDPMRITPAVVATAVAMALSPVPDASAAPLGLAVPAGTMARLIAQSRDQIRRGEAEAAYAALAARLDLYAGDPEFDYLLGIAALDSGHPGPALLAFERVLLVAPDHLQA